MTDSTITPLPYRTKVLPTRLDPALAQCPGFTLAAAARVSDSLFADRLRGLGLTPPLFAVMIVLQASGPMTQSRLSDGVGIDRATMVGLVDALEQRSWVIRTQHPGDARALLVRLAPAAVPVLEGARSIEAECQQILLQELSPLEQQQFESMLSRIVQRLTVSQGSTPPG
jgi:MarR family transcriptional regulator, lower aerobic nicotinate degradation pathway regulator